ncbi:hypothetical protein KFZ58_15585 [Virgibacillus sp. NKC19-16]|uniref:DUF4297 domain-containing protein n=1 Tax=Virgibacillus salidurans TaxID=2831673 RepID=UPI001F1BF748|nr:DUF4297 domain-containing protein [Virgibacillus sp. NKC19-16]UJL45790.1 hypothetical protein KFZ58_15585 [Virgibacillus sp. NKC19-16]
MSNVVDGGYYAIKGFNFQYDYILMKIIEESDYEKLIEIEQTEDYSDKNVIVQVKYKERTSYTKSQIKKPVCQLLQLFKTDKRTPILYAFFQNKKEEEILTIDVNYLNEIIGDCKVGNTQYTFDEKLKVEFVAKFNLIFTSAFQSQFENLIYKITEEFSCSEEEACIYYAQMYKYIEQKVVNNPPDQKKNRICNKYELIELIRGNKELIFYSAYSDFLGKEKYYSLIYNKYFRESNINFHERIFIIEVHGNTDKNELKEIIYRLRDRFFKKASLKKGTLIKSPAPYICFYNISAEVLKIIKTELLEEGYFFRDGFSFENADFNLQNVIEKCNPQNNIELKFINKIDYLDVIINSIKGIKKVYNLYTDSSIARQGFTDFNYIQIEKPDDITGFLFQR